MTSWDEIRGKIKNAYSEIESAYEKYVESSVNKVKERPVLNNAVKVALSVIPVIGPNLRDLYDNIGGAKKSEEDKAKQILEFLSKLEQQNKEQFDRIAEDLKTNSHLIIENRIAITALIYKSSSEILQEIRSLKDDTRVIREGMEQIDDLYHFKRDDSELIDYLNYMMVRAEHKVLFLQGSLKIMEYIKNREAVFVNTSEEWGKHDKKIREEYAKDIKYEETIIDSFIQSKDKILIVGAPFGVGKSSLIKRVAMDYASKYLRDRSEEEYAPLLVFLKEGINNVFRDTGDSLESLLENVISRGDRQRKILLLLDGLDEYTQDVKQLMDEVIRTKFGKYRKMKIIITTRLNAGFPEILGITEGKYLRLLPFTTDQVNLFFKNLGVNLDYYTALTLGLREEDITKPLLALMFSEVFREIESILNDIKETKTFLSNNLSKTLIYFSFMYRIFEGKTN
jgi:NACHT domain